MPAVEAIFFDFDNTLADDDASIQIALSRVCEEVGSSLPACVQELLGATYLGISDAFWLTTAYVRDISGVRLGLWREALARHECSDETLITSARDAYERHRKQVCELYEDTLEVIARLSQRYRLAIITNGGSGQQEGRLRSAGLEPHFELLVASDFGIGKPDAAIFWQALDKLGLDPATVWHVGDRLDADVLGAHNAGLTAVWLNRKMAVRGGTDPVPHHEITSLRELVALLEGGR